MKTKSNKIDYEIDMFHKFVRIVGLDVDTGSIEQLAPPNPDIICNESGIRRGFELTIITDELIEEKIGSGCSGYSSYKIEISDVVSIIQKKSKKAYVPELHVDLVIHEGATEVGDLWLCDQFALDKALSNAASLSPFARVWVLDIQNQRFHVYQGRTA